MKIVSTLVLAVLVFLALASGVSKILLMQQDVEFFGNYGFTNPMLIGFGLVQVLGGLLLVLTKTRFVGAAVVAVTFLASLALLLIEGNTAVSIVTVIAILLLGIVMRQSLRGSTSSLDTDDGSDA